MPSAAAGLVGGGSGLLGGILGAAGSSGGSQTTTTRAPQWAMPALRGALGSATSQYRNGMPNADQSSALEMIRARAQGSPLNAQAGQTLSGMMNAGPNPYLDQMFGQAADATRGRFASEFAGGGRDVMASAPFREAELTNLATNIYGGAYAQDQQNRLSAAGMAPQIAGQEYVDAQALMGAGGFQGQQLDDYIRRIGGIVGNQGTTSTPTSGNPALGFLGGANMFGSFGPRG